MSNGIVQSYLLVYSAATVSSYLASFFQIASLKTPCSLSRSGSPLSRGACTLALVPCSRKAIISVKLRRMDMIFALVLPLVIACPKSWLIPLGARSGMPPSHSSTPYRISSVRGEEISSSMPLSSAVGWPALPICLVSLLQMSPCASARRKQTLISLRPAQEMLPTPFPGQSPPVSRGRGKSYVHVILETVNPEVLPPLKNNFLPGTKSLGQAAGDGRAQPSITSSCDSAIQPPAAPHNFHLDERGQQQKVHNEQFKPTESSFENTLRPTGALESFDSDHCGHNEKAKYWRFQVHGTFDESRVRPPVPQQVEDSRNQHRLYNGRSESTNDGSLRQSSPSHSLYSSFQENQQKVSHGQAELLDL